MDTIISKSLEHIRNNMSDKMKTEIVLKLEILNEVAVETGNPWDNLLVFLIRVAMGIG